MHERFPSSEAGVVERSSNEAAERLMFWRFCSAVLGIGLMVALVTGFGPKAAGASEAVQDSGFEALRVGGFDQVDGQGVFVIENADGERVGVLPLVTGSEEEPVSP